MLKRLIATTATLACLSLLASCGNESDGTATDTSASEGTSETEDSPSEEPAEAVACDYVEGGDAGKPVDPPPSDATVAGEVPVTFETTLGDIAATLDADATPCTVNSFTSLAEQGFYDDTPCHRLTTAGIFVLQCGDPTGTGMSGPGYSYADELSGQETYAPGTLAMANAGPNTNGSQFFMVYDESPLPPQYTVFGTVSEPGVELLREMAAQGTENGTADGPPAGGVDLTSVTID
jgi:peptidyl-prolyl cis-trans isomerase B (cyclophilin B)